MASGSNDRMAEAMSKLPPEQRAKVEAAQQKAGDARKGVKLEPLGKKDKVAGFPCEWYRAVREGKPFAEACYIPFSATGLTREDFAPMMKTVESLRGLSARLGQGEESANPEWDKAPGFPGIRVSISPT